MPWTVAAEVLSFWKVLAKKSMGVLVGAPLPGAGRVAEVDLDTGCELELKVVAHLEALVPGQRLPQRLRKSFGSRGNGLLNLSRAMPIGQVQQNQISGRALDQGANGRPLGLAHEQVAFPMA